VGEEEQRTQKEALNSVKANIENENLVRHMLATELSRRSTGRTLYILDEPTTGLAFDDVAALLRVLQRLADAGNTVIVIEHHLDVIKNADYIVDLGPGAGDRGGYIVATGTPEEIAKEKSSATGQYFG